MKKQTSLRRFLACDRGTGMVEYTLLLAFVMFTVIGIANGFHTSAAGVTGVTNANLAAAARVIR